MATGYFPGWEELTTAGRWRAWSANRLTDADAKS